MISRCNNGSPATAGRYTERSPEPSPELSKRRRPHYQFVDSSDSEGEGLSSPVPVALSRRTAGVSRHVTSEFQRPAQPAAAAAGQASSQIMDKTIYWKKQAQPCEGNLQGRLAPALTARAQLAYLKKLYPPATEVQTYLEPLERNTLTTAHAQLRNNQMPPSAASEYLTILYDLHANPLLSRTVNYLGIQPKEVSALPSTALVRFMPLYHHLPSATKGVIRHSHKKVVQERLKDIEATLFSPGDKLRVSVEALQMIQRELLPLLVIPPHQDCKGELKECLTQVANSCVKMMNQGRRKDVLLYQQLQDILELAVSQGWLRASDISWAQQEIQKVLTNSLPFGPVRRTIMDCPFFLSPTLWQDRPNVIHTRSKFTYNTPALFFESVDRAVMEGFYPSALENCCRLWVHSLSFLTPQERIELKARTNSIVSIMLSAMYGATEPPLSSSTVLVAQLEFLLEMLGDDAWSTLLSPQVKSALLYLSHTVIQQRMSPYKNDQHLEGILDLAEQAEAICQLADFDLLTALEQHIVRLSGLETITPTQQQLLNRMLESASLIEDLSEPYRLALMDTQAGNLDSPNRKIMQLKALMVHVKTCSVVDMLDRIRTIIGETIPEPAMQNVIDQLRDKLVKHTIATAKHQEAQGNINEACSTLKATLSTPGWEPGHIKALNNCLERLQAREYLQSFNNPKGAATPLPDLQPLIRILVADISALNYSTPEGYLYEVVHRLACCSAEHIPASDAGQYVAALGRLHSESWGFCSGGEGFTLPGKIGSLQQQCAEKAKSVQGRQASAQTQLQKSGTKQTYHRSH